VAPVRIFPRTASRPTPLHPTHRRTSLRHMCQLRTLARRRGGEKNLRSNFAWVWPGDLFTLLILETPSEAPATFTMGSPLTRPFTRGASPANSYKGSFPEQLQRELLRSVTRGASPFSYNGSFPVQLQRELPELARVGTFFARSVRGAPAPTLRHRTGRGMSKCQQGRSTQAPLRLQETNRLGGRVETIRLCAGLPIWSLPGRWPLRFVFFTVGGSF